MDRETLLKLYGEVPVGEFLKALVQFVDEVLDRSILELIEYLE